MTTQAPGPRKIDRRLKGEPIQIDDTSVQPVAQLSGFVGFGRGKNGAGGGGWLKLSPLEVIVRTGKSAEQHIALPDPTRITVRGMVMAAMAVAVVSCFMTLVAWLARYKRSVGK